MKNDKELFISMLISTGKNLFSAEKKPEFYRMFAGVLLFAGAEAVMVTFRTNFRNGSINVYAVIIACLCFAGISAISFCQLIESDSETNLMRGIVYALIALIILYRIFSETKKANDSHHHSNGTSQLLGFLRKDGLSETVLQYLYEPILLLAVGGFYGMFDLWGGLPIMICGISIWIKWAVNHFLLETGIQKSINEKARFESTSPGNKKFIAK